MKQTWIFKYFSLLGFHSIPSMRIGGEYVKFVIPLIQLIVWSWYFLNIAKSFWFLATFMTYLDALNIFVYNITSCLVVLLIIYDSCTKRNDQNVFGQKLAKANAKYYTGMKVLNWNHLIMFALLLVGSIIDCLSGIILFDDFYETQFKIIYFSLNAILDNRIFFYIFHLRAIIVQLKEIETKLRFMRKKPFKCNQLKLIQEYNYLTHEMCENINEIFGLSQFALILMSFQSSATILNSCFRSTQKRYDFFNYGLYFNISKLTLQQRTCMFLF